MTYNTTINKTIYDIMVYTVVVHTSPRTDHTDDADDTDDTDYADYAD